MMTKICSLYPKFFAMSEFFMRGVDGTYKNISVPPEGKWLLLSLLNNTTESCALLVIFYKNKITIPFVGSFSRRES